MRKNLTFVVAILALAAVATMVFAQRQGTNTAPAHGRYLPEYTKDGDLMLPKNWRSWVYVGSPLTPDGLNDNKEGFPEYHNGYIEPGSYEIYKKTGEFPDGTIMFKELQRVLKPPQFPDGSRTEPSGRGYFPGEFNGADVTVKDSKRYAQAGSTWGYYKLQSSRAESPDRQAEAEVGVRILPPGQRKEGRGVDAVLSSAGLIGARRVSPVAIAAVVLALGSSIVDGQSDLRTSRADEKLEAVVDAQGNLRVPSTYRADYEFLGTWAIAADKGAGSKELHNVDARPGTIAEYHSRGRFPDGTVLVKEVYETSTAPMTTGTVSHVQTGLSPLSRTRPGHGLGLYVRISNAQEGSRSQAPKV